MFVVWNFGVDVDFGKFDFKFLKVVNGFIGVDLFCGIVLFVFWEGVGEGILFGCRGVVVELF